MAGVFYDTISIRIGFLERTFREQITNSVQAHALSLLKDAPRGSVSAPCGDFAISRHPTAPTAHARATSGISKSALAIPGRPHNARQIRSTQYQ